MLGDSEGLLLGVVVGLGVLVGVVVGLFGKAVGVTEGLLLGLMRGLGVEQTMLLIENEPKKVLLSLQVP